MCAQSVDIDKFFIQVNLLLKKQSYLLRTKGGPYNVWNFGKYFGNISYETELELKDPLLEREKHELRGQLIDEMLIIVKS